MSSHINEICPNFDFTCLKLDNPTLLNANIYFSKLNTNVNKNFYIQLPKCRTKQGIVSSNSKCFCDLEFNSGDKTIVEFFENLETFFIKEICKCKSLWFYESDAISDHDIQDYITPIMRSYKGGKKFLIKANIKQDKIILYDENEKKQTLSEYDSNNEIIPLLNINGIRFSKASFIIDIILVQFMVLYPSDSLENQILIKINNKKENTLESNRNTNTEVRHDDVDEDTEDTEDIDNQTNTHSIGELSKNTNTAPFKYLMHDLEIKETIQKDLQETIQKDLQETIQKDLQETIQKDLQETIQKDIQETIRADRTIELSDLDNIAKNSKPIELKSPEAIYLEIYRKAKQKAKEIRKNAVAAFLEAKNIKLKYNLNNISDDTSSDEDQ